MKFSRTIATVLVSLSMATGSFAGPNEDANALFVKTAQLWNSYQALPPDTDEGLAARVNLLEQVDSNLERIISDFPSSSLAVSLAAFGEYGILSRTEVKALIGTERAVLCQSSPSACAMQKVHNSVITEALEVARTVEEAFWRAWALADIAPAQTASGDINGAIKTLADALEAARSVENADQRARALADIAQAQAASGDTSGAKDTFAGALVSINAIDNANDRAEVLKIVSQTQATSGDIDGALETARAIEDADMRAATLVEIIAVMAQ